MGNSSPLLCLQGVRKNYEGGNQSTHLQVLKSVSVDIQKGETIGIVGPSGCGKSTLLNIIGTLDLPDGGKVEFEGRQLPFLTPEQKAEVRNRRIGFIFQSHHLLPQCSVLENVLVPVVPIKDREFRKNAEERAHDLLKKVGLSDRLTHRPGQLSGGERQRVAVVRALINNPPLLLADEPTGALDRAAAESLTSLLLQLNAEFQVTLIIVTHALDLAARMQKVYELRDGELRNITAGPQPSRSKQI